MKKEILLKAYPPKTEVSFWLDFFFKLHVQDRLYLTENESCYSSFTLSILVKTNLAILLFTLSILIKCCLFTDVTVYHWWMVSVTMRQQRPGNSDGSEHASAVGTGGDYPSRNNRMLLRPPPVLLLLLLLLVRLLFLSPANRTATFKTTRAGATTQQRSLLQIQLESGCKYS